MINNHYVLIRNTGGIMINNHYVLIRNTGGNLMNISIESIPFGVIKVNITSLEVESCNKMFCELFGVKDIEGETLTKFQCLHFLADLISKSKDEAKIYGYKLSNDMFVDIHISKTGDAAVLYFSKVEGEAAELLKYKEEKEKFKIMSAELKSKCIIIEKLREREKKQSDFVKDIINMMDTPLVVLDYPNFDVTLFNKKFLEVAKSYKCEEIIDTDKKLNRLKLLDLIKSGKFENLKNILVRCGEIGKEYTYSPLELTIEGEKKFFKLKIRPSIDKDGNTNQLCIQAVDLTDEINHSIELEKITAMKDEFFNLMSHELRTPITIIYSSIQLAKKIYKNEITNDLNKTLFRINQNCSRLLKLINNMLDISKAEAGFLKLNTNNFDIVNTTEVITNSVCSFAGFKGIDLIFDTDCEELMVSMDKDKYEKIILNLLSNAVKFTPEGKNILVTTKTTEEYIRISVKDEGIGIPAEKINAIFDRYVQVDSSLSRKAEGTGIGLALVKKLVEIMDGNIEVYSEVDKGTEFILTFKKIFIKEAVSNNGDLMDENVAEKINIEFSDVG